MLATTLTLTLICGLSPFAPAPEGDLDGTWLAVAGEEKGNTLNLEKEPVTLVFEGNKLRLSWGNEKGDYTIKFDAKADPPSMDIIYPKEKGTNHAIYALVDGKLTICISNKMNPNTPEDRPIAFTTNREKNNHLNGLILLEFRKKK